MNEKKQSFDPWQYKPWWCQPWTIILTGLTAIVLSWFVLHRLWLTIPLGFLIGVWWAYFLILWPRLLQEYMENSEDYSTGHKPRLTRNS